MDYQKPPVHVGRPGRRREARHGGPRQVTKYGFLGYFRHIYQTKTKFLIFLCIIYVFFVI